MVGVSLQCAIVGQTGSSFHVEIDDGVKVSKLKEAIKAKKPLTITCEADHLHLFLAKKKKGDGAWLTEKDVQEGVHDTRDLLLLDVAGAPLNLVGLSGGEVLFRVKKEHVQAKTVPVNVLVAVPGFTTTVKVNETQGKDLTDELAYYQRIGQEIKNNCQKQCGPILDKIDTIYEKGSYPMPFICVQGSSGMGKSQLAFALGGEGRTHPRPWFYWPLLSGEERQRVYRNFSSIATAFDSVVKKEDLMEQPVEEILNCTSPFYSTQELWTYGFIIELLEYCSGADVGAQMIRVEIQTFKATKSTRDDVIDVRSRMEETGEVLPFFILDEMTPSRDIPNMMKLAAFQRNVFRACGLVVIVMGTDSKISDLVSQSYHGRTDSHWWMSVVSRFPPYQSIASGGPEKDDAWQKVTQLHPVVNHIAEHSRGLFSRCFVDAVVHFALKKIAGNETFALADLLDAAFKAVYVKAQAAKGFMTTPEGRCAQLMALSYTNASGEHPDCAISGDDMSERASTKRRKLDLDVGVANMHLHFANLIDEEITDVVVSRGNLEYQVNGRPWSPICRFPVVEEDVLLYLAVLGGKKFSAYHNYKAEKRHSVVGVFKDFRKQCGSETHENKKAPRNDFSEFENLVAHAIFCASRMNGVRGIAFNEFFSVLIGEFRSEPYQREESNQTEESKQSEQTDQTEKFDSSALLEKYDRLKEKFRETRIPFLAPPNARWPDYILRACGNGDCDCNFGHLVRAKDEERLDCYVMVPGNDNPLFICECKHWKKKLDSGAMEKIIEGLNAEYKGRPGRDGHRKRKWNNWDLAFVFCDEITQFQQAKMDAWGFPGTGIVTVDCKTWVYNYPVVKWIIKPNAGEKLVIVVQTGRLFLSGISGVVK